MRPIAAAATGFLFLFLAGASGCGNARSVQGGTLSVVRVPGQAATVADALRRVAPGGLVLVGPGVYRESVRVTTPGVTLRGLDRDGVVLDGEGTRNNGVEVTAPGVTVENLTTRRHLYNGVLVTGMTNAAGEGLGQGSAGYSTPDTDRDPPLSGFAVRYVTSANNGLYGIYAFHAQNGVIEHTYTSGGADSGLYVGQCKPCHIVVRGNVAEHNAVGFENANASGDMHVLGNRFTGNRVGLTITSDYQEAFIPQRGSVVAGNLISHNNEPGTPVQAEGGFGIGAGIAGGQGNLLTRNRIEDNQAAGVLVTSREDIPPDDNRVVGNRVRGNGTDLAYAASATVPGSRTCFARNAAVRVAPAALTTVMGCPNPRARTAGAAFPQPPAPEGIAFLDVVPPPAQPSLPDPEQAPHPRAAGVVPAGGDRLPGDSFLRGRSVS